MKPFNAALKLSAILFLLINSYVNAQGLQGGLAIIRGKILHYSPSSVQNRLTYIYSPIEESRIKDTLSVASDGSFQLIKEIGYPQEVVMLYNDFRTRVLVHPGKQDTIWIDYRGFHQNPGADLSKLSKDRERYDQLNSSIAEGKPVQYTDTEYSDIVSIEHATYLSNLYQDVTRKFSPGSTRLYNNYIATQDFAAIAKMAIRSIQTKTNGLTKDLFISKGLNGLIEANRLKEVKEIWKDNLITDSYLRNKILLKMKAQEVFLANQQTESSAVLVENEKIEALDILLTGLKGKVVYVDFWAPWCAPCMKTMPDSKLLQQSFKNKKVAFVFVSSRTSTESWKATIANKKFTGIYINLNQQQWSAVSKKFKISFIPHALLIDKYGNLNDDNAPAANQQATLQKQIDRLLD
jgi:thiol-disulfide isomerase/thioredoxin